MTGARQVLLETLFECSRRARDSWTLGGNEQISPSGLRVESPSSVDEGIAKI